LQPHVNDDKEITVMKRSTISKLLGPAAVAVAAAGAAALAGCSSSTAGSPPAATPAARHGSITFGPMYRYYHSMMGRYQGGMMGGGSGGWMMGMGGYRWMTGGHGVPGWMHGGRLPGYMMSGGADMGTIMGRFWAGAPGPRVSHAQAARLGSQLPAGARADRALGTVTFSTADIRLAVIASPPGGRDETFRIAGMVNPKLIVPAGAKVTIQVVNADPDTAHGLVISAPGAARSWMPMMTASPAFPGSALWFLGNPTSAGLHTATLTFTASRPGTYRYLCAVPGHARKGMTGVFVVR
jgi:rusticyanin